MAKDMINENEINEFGVNERSDHDEGDVKG
jgi:hypothetical protein